MVKKCSECGLLYEDSQDECEKCGRRLGEGHKFVPSEPDEPEVEEDHDSGPGLVLRLLNLVPGVVRPKVVVLSVVMFMVSVAGFGLAAFMVGMGAVLTAFTVGGGAVMLYWTCWGWLLYGDVCTPTEALTDLRGSQWMVLFVVTVIPFGLAIWMMRLAAGGS